MASVTGKSKKESVWDWILWVLNMTRRAGIGECVDLGVPSRDTVSYHLARIIGDDAN